MSTVICDGTGSGSRARVDEENRLNTKSISIDQYLYLRYSGRVFSYNTGIIDLTSSSASAVFYLETTGTNDIIVAGCFLQLGFSKDISGTPNTITGVKVEVLGDITSHDLASAVYGFNQRSSYGITNPMTAYKGAEGKAFTGGTLIAEYLAFHGSRFEISNGAAFFMRNGDNLGIRITPPSGTAAGNDKMQISATMLAYVDDGSIYPV